MSLTNKNGQIGKKNGETERETDRNRQRQQIGQEHALSWRQVKKTVFTGKKGEGALHGDGNILYLTLDNCLISSVQSLSRV